MDFFMTPPFQLKSDLNASSEELSSNESSTDNNTSSDSDLSSHVKDSEADVIRTRNSPILHKSTSGRDNGVTSEGFEVRYARTDEVGCGVAAAFRVANGEWRGGQRTPGTKDGPPRGGSRSEEVRGQTDAVT